MEPGSRKEKSVIEGQDPYTISEGGKSITEEEFLRSAMNILDSARRAEAMAQEAEKEIPQKSKAQKKKEKKELEQKRLAEENVKRRIANLQLEQKMAEYHWKAIKAWNIQDIKKNQLVTVHGPFVLLRTYYNRIFETKAQIIHMLKEQIQDERFKIMLHTTSSVVNDKLINWMENYLKRMKRNFIMAVYELKEHLTGIHSKYFNLHQEKLRYLTTKHIEKDFAEFELNMAAELYTSRETEEDELKQELYEKTYCLNRSKTELNRKLITDVIPFVHTVQNKKKEMDLYIQEDEKKINDLEKRTQELEKLHYLKEELTKKLKLRLAEQEDFNKRIRAKREYLDSIQETLQKRLQYEIEADAENMFQLVNSSNKTIERLKKRLEKATKVLSMITIIRKYETIEEQNFNYKMTLRKNKTIEEQRLNYGERMKFSDLVDCDYGCNTGCMENVSMAKFWKRVARAFDLSLLLKCERNKLVQERDCFCRLTRKIIMEVPHNESNCQNIQHISFDYKSCERLILNDIKSRSTGNRMIIS